MEKLIFSLVLALVAWLISLLTGRNRRQLEKVPEGMAILCQPPGKRYVLYALGVVVMAVVLFFGFSASSTSWVEHPRAQDLCGACV